MHVYYNSKMHIYMFMYAYYNILQDAYFSDSKRHTNVNVRDQHYILYNRSRFLKKSQVNE